MSPFRGFELVARSKAGGKRGNGWGKGRTDPTDLTDRTWSCRTGSRLFRFGIGGAQAAMGGGGLRGEMSRAFSAVDLFLGALIPGLR
ncbi:hypothetical protein SBV1_2580007 [Verrucomicrobia bacterium]|nr:hypothetical protein SBV1_2580007 [Verrucomicrobiota bacterium]